MSGLFAASSAFASTVAQKHSAQFAGRTVRFGNEDTDDDDQNSGSAAAEAVTIGTLLALAFGAFKGFHPKNLMGDAKKALEDKKIDRPYLLIAGTGIGKVTKGISKAVAFPFKKAAETQPVIKIKARMEEWGNKINPFKPALEEDEALEEAAEKALDLAA